ncbi:Uncharacterized protein SCF082_LOCUS2835 [Durusdinium trenchii]|uniref:Uncharacterized protein n=1 Tax=Durusdinium trenchii TaxID=1381693 RepID=A0ABP0HNR3_9DINO
MHRTSAVTRKGLHAAERPVVLDVGRFGRARYQASDLNLVAEPMEAPGRCGCIARTLVLTLLCLLSSVGVFTLLVLTTDGTSPMPTGMRMESEHGQDNSSALLPHDIHEHNDQVAVVEVTTTTSAQQQQRFQMTFTADVLADADGRLRVSLANGSGFFVAYNDDSYIQPVDKQSHGLLHELSEQTLTFVRDSLEAASGEKRQNRRLDEKHQTTTAHPGAAFVQASRVWFTKSAPVRRFGFFLLVSMPPIVMISIVCFMQQGPYRPHPSQHGQPRQHVHQSDAGPPFVGTATLKVPPSRSIERNHIYSLRAWISDLVPWASASDLEAVRHGPIAALQVQGSAVSEGACNELTPHHLQHGDIDPMTGQQLTGLMLLVTVLGRRYAPLEAENVTKSIAEFLSFRRMPGESIDSTLVRFDILRNRAHVRAGFGINWTGLAWLLTQSLQLNAETWDRLLVAQCRQIHGSAHGSIDVDGLDPTEVYQDYAYARKQWRRVSGRYPRICRLESSLVFISLVPSSKTSEVKHIPAAPTREPGHPPRAESLHTAAEVTPLLEGAREPQFPPPSEAPFVGRAEDAASFPWWEVEDGATCDRQTQPQIGAAYHLRTRRKDGTVGLLIDPGARDNLIGSVTARQMCQELASKLQERQMDKSLPVEGVYKQAHVADISARISMNVIDAAGDATPASYTAPMIDQSMLPPLLGNRTLRRMQSLIDCGNGRLVIPGPGGMELRLSPGSKVYELELTDSGHWVEQRALRTDPGGILRAVWTLKLAMAVSSARGPHSQQTIAKGQPELNQDQLNYDEKGVKKSVLISGFAADNRGIDCIELFGGSGTTILILAKHHNMTTGLNFEMLCGVDLQQAPDVTYLFAYIERNKPKVAILAPPCVTSIVRSILKHGSVAVPQVLLWAS